jgi:hypothetical protein
LYTVQAIGTELWCVAQLYIGIEADAAVISILPSIISVWYQSILVLGWFLHPHFLSFQYRTDQMADSLTHIPAF